MARIPILGDVIKEVLYEVVDFPFGCVREVLGMKHPKKKKQQEKNQGGRGSSIHYHYHTNNVVNQGRRPQVQPVKVKWLRDNPELRKKYLGK